MSSTGAALLATGSTDGTLRGYGSADGALLVNGSAEGALRVTGSTEGALRVYGSAEGARRLIGSTDGALGPLDDALAREDARICAVAPIPLGGGTLNSGSCSSVADCELMVRPPIPSALYIPEEGRLAMLDLTEPELEVRSIGSATSSCATDDTWIGRVLGPSLAKPSATGLRISARLGCASRLRKDNTGEVVVALSTGLPTRLFGGGSIAASAVPRIGEASILRGVANLEFRIAWLGWDCFRTWEDLFFQGSCIVIEAFPLFGPSPSSTD